MSRHAVAKRSFETEIKISRRPLLGALPACCLQVSIFAFGEHYAATQRLDAVTTKNFRWRQKLLVQIADKRSLQAWPFYRLFESEFDRDSDFETPVAVFILQVELYAVTTGLTTVGGSE
jgi:hypothetical protein